MQVKINTSLLLQFYCILGPHPKLLFNRLALQYSSPQTEGMLAITIISGPLSIEQKTNYVFNVFFHYSPHFFPVLATCLVDLPEVTGTHRKFRSIVSSLIGMD